MNVLLVAELRSCARYAGLSIADRAADRIEALEAWIKEESAMNGTCTYNILGEKCDGCGCKRAREAK